MSESVILLFSTLISRDEASASVGIFEKPRLALTNGPDALRSDGKRVERQGKDAQIAAIPSSRRQAMSLLRSEIEFH
jgi:hypothetical protein